MAFSSVAVTEEQTEDRNFAPWSLIREVGPKQPEQGMLPLTQSAPQPPRVAGPMHTSPWLSRHFSGSTTTWCGRLNSEKARSVGLLSRRGHSSQRAVSGARTVPLGGALPARSAPRASWRSLPVGGQPGR